MLTRFVRIQLTIFTVASIIGLAVVLFSYLQVPTMLGLGKITVKLELSSGGGLYRFSNVTYRGITVGKVTGVRATLAGAEATMSLNASPRIPADLRAEVHSVSAVGEQYVDLLPRTRSGPYLADGSVIPRSSTSIPQAVGPMLDQVSKLVDSVPKVQLGNLLDESYKAFNGAGFDFGSLVDSSSTVIGDVSAVSDRARALVDDGEPLLDSQAQTADSIRRWAAGVAGVSGQVVKNDPQLRALLSTGPAAEQEVSQLLNQLKPTLPVLLANLTTLGQILVTYNASLEQILILLPAYVSAQDSLSLPQNNPVGWPISDFTITANDPPACTVGFLPPQMWRSPADESDVDTPENLYCKLPQDSPIAVRGARNYPCMGHPGKRAPTVEICDSDKPFEPLAMRQHIIGPYPVDPNLISQGIPPDDRATYRDNTFGPVDGTPMPPDAALPPADSGAPASTAAPSAFSGHGAHGPSVAITHYDPHSGIYLTPDGHLEQQANLIRGATPKTWKDMLPT